MQKLTGLETCFCLCPSLLFDCHQNNRPKATFEAVEVRLERTAFHWSVPIQNRGKLGWPLAPSSFGS